MSDRVALQRLVLSDPELGAPPELYAHAAGAVQRAEGHLAFEAGGHVSFQTYFNSLNLGTWCGNCHLDGLWLTLEGRGTFTLKVWRVTAPETAECVLAEEIALDGAARVDLDAARAAGTGLLSFELTAHGPATLTGGGFETRSPDTPRPRLAISITTFRRETQVRETVMRLRAFLDGFEHGDDVRLIVVDNGRSLRLPELPGLTVLENPNLGGAGGFARGLTHALDTGASHVLFMDDDAAFGMENIRRTHAFLWLARDPRTALAGAMISNAKPHAMWENGAVFFRSCRPRHNGTDLCDPQALVAMELDAAGEPPENFYGGWWFFAFPLAQVRHWPFPFFVRGDDISFSLVHDFRIATLTGVASFQDDFPAKEAPLTLYLDLRNHLVHHLVVPRLEIGRWRTAWIAWRFILRSLARFHYESAAAQMLAVEDVMEGPDLFARHADMAERRASVGALTENETWHPVGRLPAKGEETAEAPGSRLAQRAYAVTVNGHLLPFFRLWARRVRVPVKQRGLLWPIWGAQRITYLDADEIRGYTTAMSRRRFARTLARLVPMTLRFARDYPRLKAEYRARYPELASRTFWESRFGPASSNEPATRLPKEKERLDGRRARLSSG